MALVYQASGGAQLYIYTVKKKQLKPIFPSLVGGLEHFCFPIGMMIQSDELIFFRGVETTNQP